MLGGFNGGVYPLLFERQTEETEHKAGKVLWLNSESKV
jgi:hypothetical protein